MSADAPIDPDIERLTKAATVLMEHFDSVQIFCTRHEGDGTVRISEGAGNYYARFGQVEEWMIREKEVCRKPQRTSEED